MSNEILNDSQFPSLDGGFWEIIRHHGSGISTQHMHFAVAAMVFAHSNADLLKSPTLPHERLLGESKSFVESKPYGSDLGIAFTSLRSEIGQSAFAVMVVEFARLTNGLTEDQCLKAASIILGQIRDRGRLRGSSFPGTKDLAELMLALTESDKLPNSNVFIPYVPYEGIAGLIHHREQMTCFTVSNEATASMAVYQLIEGGVAELWPHGLDTPPGVYGRYRDYGRVVAAPPFNCRFSGGHWSGRVDCESFCIDQISKNLVESPGRAAICVSPGLLFRGTHDHISLRESIVETGLVEAVIQLPAQILRHTQIAPVIIILSSDRGRSNAVRFIDASDCFWGEERNPILNIKGVIERARTRANSQKSVTITADELDSCDYDLTPGRHLLSKDIFVPEGHSQIRLGKVMSEVRPSRVRPHHQGVLMERKSFPDTTTGFEFSFADAPLIRVSEMERWSSYRIVTGSYLIIDTIARRGEIRAFWFSHQGKDLLVRPDIRCFEVNEHEVDPRWLAMVINSSAVAEQVKTLLMGGGILRLRMDLLFSLSIAKPDSLDQQRAILQSTADLQVKAKAKEIGLEGLLKQQREDFLNDIRMRKHNLAQVASDISSRVSVIHKLLKRQGSLDAGLPIGKQKLSAADYLGVIVNRCEDLGSKLESLTQIHTISDLEDLPLKDAFNALEESCKGRNFRLRTEIDLDSFTDQGQGDDSVEDDEKAIEPIIQIALKDFMEICENILENAERHGFVDDTIDHQILVVASLDKKDQMVFISFKNTGKPFPKGLNKERYVMRGEKGGPTGNTGTGGYHINSVMEQANGHLEIHNHTEDLYPAEVKLFFPYQS